MYNSQYFLHFLAYIPIVSCEQTLSHWSSATPTNVLNCSQFEEVSPVLAFVMASQMSLFLNGHSHSMPVLDLRCKLQFLTHD